MRRSVRVAILTAGLAGIALPAIAHHSFAMFDTTRRVTLAGTVTARNWRTVLAVDAGFFGDAWTVAFDSCRLTVW